MWNSPNSVPFSTLSCRWESALLEEKAISWQNNWFWFHSSLCQCSSFHEALESFELPREYTKSKSRLHACGSSKHSLKVRCSRQSRNRSRKEPRGQTARGPQEWHGSHSPPGKPGEPIPCPGSSIHPPTCSTHCTLSRCLPGAKHAIIKMVMESR